MRFFPKRDHIFVEAGEDDEAGEGKCCSQECADDWLMEFTANYSCPPLSPAPDPATVSVPAPLPGLVVAVNGGHSRNSPIKSEGDSGDETEDTISEAAQWAAHRASVRNMFG